MFADMETHFVHRIKNESVELVPDYAIPFDFDGKRIL